MRTNRPASFLALITSEGGAFTLIELLVLVAIVALLVAVRLSALASGRENAMRTRCSANLRQLGLGCDFYADDYSGEFPFMQVGGNPLQVVRDGYYTRWLFFDGNKPGLKSSRSWDNYDDDPGTSSTFWRDFGMIYPIKAAGDSNVFLSGSYGQELISGRRILLSALDHDRPCERFQQPWQCSGKLCLQSVGFETCGNVTYLAVSEEKRS